jgi:hypothetical protein
VYLFRQNLSFLAEAQPSQFSSLQYKNSQIAGNSATRYVYFDGSACQVF